VVNDTAGPESEGLDLDIDLGGFDVDLGDILGTPAPGPADSGQEPPAGFPDKPLDQRGRVREPSRGGRPTLYTLPRVLTILAELFRGASRAEAARRAGVGASTFYVWLQLGRAGHPAFAPLAEAVANVEDARGFKQAFRGRSGSGVSGKPFPESNGKTGAGTPETRRDLRGRPAGPGLPITSDFSRPWRGLRGPADCAKLCKNRPIFDRGLGARGPASGEGSAWRGRRSSAPSGGG
jgi:hypothetical protein